MRIRPATKKDIAEIKMLLDRNFDEVMFAHHSKSVLEKFKSHNSLENLLAQLDWKYVYVVEDDGVVGTGALADFGTSKQPKFSMSNLYVLPERQGQGIGRILFEQIMSEAKSRNVDILHVPSSRNAVSFYEKMGFLVDEDQPDIEDEITWMSIKL